MNYWKLVRFCILLLLLSYQSAGAWDGVVFGTITAVDIVTGPGSAPGNYDVRIYLAGFPTMCTGGSNWAYLNIADANYNSLVATAMTAKVTGSTVRIWTVLEYGQCHIGYLQIS